ncbi:MAG: hypothetical protein KGO82_01550 [Bacteroidota bacterium]|nr:hypothetical protein [Bacteroidota bacterium]
MSKLRLLLTLSLGAAFFALVFIGCSKGNSTPADPCSGVTITVSATATDADAGSSNGSISATATGSSGLTYSLNGGTAQATGAFTNLAAGSYTVTVKNANGCSGSTNVTVNAKDACAGKTITVTATITKNADPCASDGTATVSATGSTGFTYSVDAGTYGASASFTGLSAGNHTFNAKDAGGCIKSSTVSVPAVAAGTKFAAVKAIIVANCAVTGCHAGTQSPNFTIDCNIVANADLIKTRAVDGANTANQMPQPPRAALAQGDRDAITAWIAAGKHYTD